MPDIPESATAAAAEAITFAANHFEAGEAESSALRFARAALEAAAPILAEACATAILAHMEAHDKATIPSVRRAWRRHFGIAARVAAGAFDTREDQLRMAAEAIGRGDWVRCDIPEVPRIPPPGSDRGARIVACPSCGAPAGGMCRTMTQRTPGVPGYEMSWSHAARKRAAVAARDIPEVSRDGLA